MRVFGGVDFLSLNVDEEPWCSVVAVLLDPSCSGSGIVGREDGEVEGSRGQKSLEMTNSGLSDAKKEEETRGQKRKRRRALDERNGAELRNGKHEENGIAKASPEQEVVEDRAKDSSLALEQRLNALSALQTKMLVHAFSFPRARRVTYSTCSIHDKENEGVVVAVLASEVARTREWRILRREEQVDGLKAWKIRGNLQACASCVGAEDIAQACIRCEKYTGEGTQGFFVAGFVRDEIGNKHNTMQDENDEWNGFGD